MPRVIQDNRANWVDDHVDALVAEFAPEDDTLVIVTEEDDADGDDDDGAHDSAGGVDGDDEDCTRGRASS